MRYLLPLALLLLGAAPAEQALPVHVGGRVAQEPNGTLRFGWPGVYFEGRFRGTAVTMRVDSGTEQLRLLVDGEARATLAKPGIAEITLSDLADGEHIVRLEKMSESQSGGARFLGFTVPAAATPLPAKPRSRRIEFIGDSYSVGYGNSSPVRSCTQAEIHDTTDTQRAFGPLLAKRIDADYRVNAMSGFGIVRNYDGSHPGDTLPTRYDRAIPGNTAPLDRGNDWRPQLIVINLGTNDFSTPVHAGEAWKDEAALRRDYRERYIGFARELMRTQPQARLILMGSDAFYGDVEQVAKALGPRATTLHFGNLELTGCDWHPSLKDQVALADLLEGAIGKLPGVWN